MGSAVQAAPASLSGSPSSASATVPRRSSRASTSTATPIRPRRCLASCTCSSAPYHVRDIEFVAAFDVDAKKVGLDLSQAILASENNTIKICDVPQLGVPVQRGHTLDGLGKYYRETITESDEEPVDVVAVLKDEQGRRPDLLPAGRLGAGGEVLRAVRHRRQGRVRQRAAGVHRQHAGVGEEVRRRRRADRRRRHQVAGRRDHHPPRARQAVRGPRRRGPAHLPAQRRRQHGLQEHARARATGVEEDQQDAVGHLADPRPRPRCAQRAHRPVGLRAWLDDRKWAFVRLEGKAFGECR